MFRWIKGSWFISGADRFILEHVQSFLFSRPEWCSLIGYQKDLSGSIDKHIWFAGWLGREWVPTNWSDIDIVFNPHNFCHTYAPFLCYVMLHLNLLSNHRTRPQGWDKIPNLENNLLCRVYPAKQPKEPLLGNQPCPAGKSYVFSEGHLRPIFTHLSMYSPAHLWRMSDVSLLT